LPPDHAAQSDLELMQAVTTGDNAAFMALYDRYNRIAFGLAYRILGNAGPAEEAVQDAFMQVWNRAATWQDRGEGSVRSWLLAIVHHRAIDTYRRSARHDQRSVNLDDHLELRALGEVWEDVDRRLTAEEVRSALDTLPHDQRQAIDLAYFGGLSQSEIAEQEEIPLGTVKGRMRLGLSKLRTALTMAERDATSGSGR
jgi:RNA polymerase sigma-70 factor (ECF subfamily)